jgi:preprotein translocase subunit SecD
MLKDSSLGPLALGVLGGVLLACGGVRKGGDEASPERVACTGPADLVIRPLSPTSTDNRKELAFSGSDQPPGRGGFFFDPRESLASLADIEPTSFYIEPRGSAFGTPLVWFELNPAGTASWAQWTSQNVGSHIGIFVGSRLLASPRIDSPMTTGHMLIHIESPDDAALLGCSAELLP